MIKFAVALAFIGLNFYVYNYFGSEDVFPERTDFAELPLEQAGWLCSGVMEMGEDEEEILGVTDYLLCDFRNADRQLVNVYVGYHKTQVRREGANETVIHPPEHCLPGGGWDIIESSVVPVDFGIPGEAKRVVIAKGNARALVYFWYQSRGRVIARDHHKILYMFLDRALHGRSDGSLVRFTVPIVDRDVELAEANFREVASALGPELPKYVPN